jgi:hypothetical protein
MQSVIENLGHNSVLYDRVPLVNPDQRSKGQVAYHANQIELNGLQPPPERQLSITQKFRASPVRESKSSGLRPELGLQPRFFVRVGPILAPNPEPEMPTPREPVGGVQPWYCVSPIQAGAGPNFRSRHSSHHNGNMLTESDSRFHSHCVVLAQCFIDSLSKTIVPPRQASVGIRYGE